MTTTMTPGTYVLSTDVPNPHYNGRHRYDWRRAMRIIAAGTRFHVTRQRWFYVTERDRVAGDLAGEIEPDGWIYQLQLTMDGERPMYDVSSRNAGETKFWTLLTPHLMRVEDDIDDVLKLARVTTCMDGDDVLRMLVATGQKTLDDVRALLADAKAWSDTQPDD